MTASVSTLYPFSDALDITVTAQKAFTYYVRIPSWTVGGTVTVNGGDAQSVTPGDNGLHAISVGEGTTKIALNLPADITVGTYVLFQMQVMGLREVVEDRQNGSVAVHRGPLHYAFDISRSSKVLTRNAEQPMAVDLEFDATETWQYAIDTSTLQFHNSPPSSGSLPSPIYDSGLPPMSMTVTACEIEWSVAGDTFASSPPSNPECTGPATNITLWPYGVCCQPLPSETICLIIET